MFFYKIIFFGNFFQGYLQSDTMSGLIWIHTVCKGYQQTTVAGKELTVRHVSETQSLKEITATEFAVCLI